MLKGIIFDFDGVIAKSVRVKTDAFVSLYKHAGDKVLGEIIKHHEENGGMSRFEKIKLYHKRYLNQTLDDQQLNSLSKQFSNLVVSRVINAPYVSGSVDYIKKSHEKYKLFYFHRNSH